jgi:hypothetical protein
MKHLQYKTRLPSVSRAKVSYAVENGGGKREGRWKWRHKWRLSFLLTDILGMKHLEYRPSQHKTQLVEVHLKYWLVNQNSLWFSRQAFLVWKFLPSCIFLDMFKYWVDQIKKNEMGGVCVTYGGDVSCIEGFGGETWRKKPVGKPGREWADNININFQDMVWETWNALIWLRIGTSGRLLWKR